MRFLLLLLLILFTYSVKGQYKSFKLGSDGDTLNKIDLKGMKQGKWILKMPPLRGEPGYEEEGVFVNDRKEGKWLRFNLMGDPLAIEFYKWGNKNGLCRYFTPAGPEHDESWRAINPDKAYDTIDVQDLKDPNKYEKVIVKNDGNSLRHGTWRYYFPPTGKLVGTEHYFMNKLQEPGSVDPLTGLTTLPAIDSTKLSTDSSKTKALTKPKPKEVMEFEKKTSNKKKVVRDGRTGG